MILQITGLLTEIEKQRQKSRTLIVQAQHAVQISRELIERSRELVKVSQMQPEPPLHSAQGTHPSFLRNRSADFI